MHEHFDNFSPHVQIRTIQSDFEYKRQSNRPNKYTDIKLFLISAHIENQIQFQPPRNRP